MKYHKSKHTGNVGLGLAARRCLTLPCHRVRMCAAQLRFVQAVELSRVKDEKSLDFFFREVEVMRVSALLTRERLRCVPARNKRYVWFLLFFLGSFGTCGYPVFRFSGFPVFFRYTGQIHPAFTAFPLVITFHLLRKMFVPSFWFLVGSWGTWIMMYNQRRMIPNWLPFVVPLSCGNEGMYVGRGLTLKRLKCFHDDTVVLLAEKQPFEQVLCYGDTRSEALKKIHVCSLSCVGI